MLLQTYAGCLEGNSDLSELENQNTDNVQDRTLEYLTYEQWQTKLIEKYQKLYDTVQEHLIYGNP